MTILDRTRRRGATRVDVGQLADELARRMPDLEHVDLARARDVASEAVQEASARARLSLDRATERARSLRSDLARSGDESPVEHALGDLGRRLASVGGPDGLRSVIARLERELPGTDKDRYDRAYARGRNQARSTWLAVGVVLGIALGVAGAVAALLLEPRHGRERRDALGGRVRELTGRVSGGVSDSRDRVRARLRTERAPMAVMDVPMTPLPDASGPMPDPGTDPEAHAHEALATPPAPEAAPPTEGDPTDLSAHA